MKGCGNCRFFVMARRVASPGLCTWRLPEEVPLPDSVTETCGPLTGDIFHKKSMFPEDGTNCPVWAEE